VDATFSVFSSSPLSKKKKIRPVPIVDPVTFEQMLQQAKDAGQGRVLQAIAPLNFFLPHLALPKVFDSSHTQRDLQGSGLQVPDIRSYYPKIVEYCLRTDWGRRVTS